MKKVDLSKFQDSAIDTTKIVGGNGNDDCTTAVVTGTCDGGTKGDGSEHDGFYCDDDIWC